MEIFYDYMSKLKLDRDDYETSIWVKFNRELVIYYDYRGEKLFINDNFYEMLKSSFPFIEIYDLVSWFEKTYNVNVTHLNGY
jgi:hypothetical protein